MSVFRFDPSRGFESIARRMSNLAGEFEKGVSFEFGGFSPRIDISEDENKLYVNAELPGIEKEDVKLSVNEDNLLLISGNKKNDEDREKRSFIRVERNFGEFSRSLVLPENINRESIAAKFENGILYITLDKIEPEKPKEIKIEIL